MIAILNLFKKAFIVYIVYFDRKILIYSAWKARIILLLIKKITVLAEYLDFIDIFSKKSAVKFFEHSDINKYLINLELGKQ